MYFDRAAIDVPREGDANVRPALAPGLVDMRNAVLMAVEWHPTIRNAVASLQESSEYIDAARAGYYPQVRGGVNSQFGNRNADRYGGRQVHRATLSATQMLYDFGKVSSGVDKAMAQQLAARARVLLAMDQLVQDTAHAVIEVQRYQRLDELAQEQITGVSAIANLARQRRALGASTLSDETQAEAREDAARATSLQMKAQLQRWRSALSHLLGQAQAMHVTDQVPSALGQSCSVAEPDWLLVPAVMVAEADRAAARAELDQRGAQTLPTLSLEGSVSRGLNAQSSVDGSRNDATVMVNLSMPLYQGGMLQATRRAAAHALGAADSAVTHARLSASQGLMDARAQAVGLQQRNQVLGNRTQSILRTRDLYRQQYLDLGTRTLLDLLNAEQEYHQARFDHAHNQHDLYRLQVACLYGAGRLRDAFALADGTIAGLELRP